MYTLTLDMLLPVPTTATLYQTTSLSDALREYRRTVYRLGPALSTTQDICPQLALQAALADDRTLTLTRST